MEKDESQQMFVEISVFFQIADLKGCVFEGCVDKTAGWLPILFSKFLSRCSVPHAELANVHYSHKYYLLDKNNVK